MKSPMLLRTRQILAALLEQAEKEGEVHIRRRDGRRFVVRLEQALGSPLNVPGIDHPIGLEAILEGIWEGRDERY